MGLRLGVAALFLLLAGCATPALPAAPPSAAESEILVEEPVTFWAMSPMWICVAGPCGGVSGPDSYSFDGRTYTGFRLEVSVSEDPFGAGVPYPVGVPQAQVRIVVECAGDSRTCPAGVLAETQGPWPATLEASGFRIADPDLLVFKVEYLGPYPRPVNGSGQGFDFEGTLTSVEGSEADGEDEGES